MIAPGTFRRRWEPRLRTEAHGAVTRAWLEVPGDGRIGFDHSCAGSYASAVGELVGESVDRTVWLYSPMALELAAALARPGWCTT